MAAALSGTVATEPKNQSCACITWDSGKTARHYIWTNYLEHADGEQAQPNLQEKLAGSKEG